MKKVAFLFLFFSIFLSFPRPILASVANLYPTDDTFTLLTRRNVVHGDDTILSLDKDSKFSPETGGTWINDVYIIFDLSGLPKMAKINRATLQLHQLNVRHSYNSTVDILRLKGLWDEHGLTYDYRPKPVMSNPADPQYIITPAGIQNWDITRMAQEWVDGTPNFGMVIKMVEASVDWYSEFYSKEAGDRNLRPQLIVDYGLADISPLTVSEVKGEFINPTTAKITWKTNRYTNSLVQYRDGVEYKPGQQRGTSFETTKDHLVYLEDFKPNVTYHFKVISECSLNDPEHFQSCNFNKRTEKATSSEYELKPFSQPDKTINISNIKIANTKEDSVTIKWTTDKTSFGEVEYGLSRNYGSSKKEVALTTTHQITLTGLQAGTTYHFRLKSSLLLYQTGVTRDYAFTTAAKKATPPEADNPPVATSSVTPSPEPEVTPNEEVLPTKSEEALFAPAPAPIATPAAQTTAPTVDINSEVAKVITAQNIKSVGIVLLVILALKILVLH